MHMSFLGTNMTRMMVNHVPTFGVANPVEKTDGKELPYALYPLQFGEELFFVSCSLG